MNPVLHQWKWDFRRIRLAWSLWMALLILTTTFQYLALGSASRRSPLLPLSSLMEVLVIYLFGALLVAFAVFTTPFSGSSAFWKTRPLPSSALFWQKTLLIITMVWIPVIISRGALYLLIDPDPSILSNVALTYLPLTLGIYLLTALLSTLCADVRSLIMALASAIGFVLILGLLTAFVRRGMETAVVHFGNTDVTSRWHTIVTGLLLLAVIALVAWFLGALLKRRLAATIAAALALATLASQNTLWSVGVGSLHLPKTSLDLVVLDRDQQPDPSLSPLYPQLAAVLPADQIFIPVEMQSQLTRNQQQLQTGSHGNFSSIPARQLRRLYPAETRFITSEHRSSANLVHVDNTPAPGTFSGHCSGIIFRFQPLGSMPAEQGATKQFKGYGIVRIGRPDPRHEEFEIPVSSVTRNRHFDRRRHLPISTNSNLIAILRHTETGTIVAPEFGGNSTGGGFNLVIQTEELRFTDKALHAALGRPATIHDLSEFAFDLYALTPLASATGTFHKDHWVPFTDRSSDPEQTTTPDDTWTKALLPDDPTPAQVDAYLDTIMFGLPGNVRREQAQILQSKFNALGTTHLHHLIARLPVPHYLRSPTHQTIRNTATRDHLPALLAAFRKDPAVAGILLQKRWQQEGVGIAHDHLRQLGPFSENDTVALVTIATTTPDPAINDDLLRHFILADQWHGRMIKNLRQQPGFPLEEAIAKAWDRKRADLNHSPEIAYHAIRLGDPEALRQALVHCASLPNDQDQRYRDQLDLLDAAIDQPDGTNPATWARSHFPQLRFHPDRHTFHLP